MGILENWHWVDFLIGFALVYLGYRMGRRSTAPKYWEKR